MATSRTGRSFAVLCGHRRFGRGSVQVPVCPVGVLIGGFNSASVGQHRFVFSVRESVLGR